MTAAAAEGGRRGGQEVVQNNANLSRRFAWLELESGCFFLPRWRVVAVLLTVMSSADDELALLYSILRSHFPTQSTSTCFSILQI